MILRRTAAWLLLLLTLAASAPAAQPAPHEIARLDPPLAEASGLVKSRQYDDVYWTLADSGNTAHVFAYSAAGRRLAAYEITGAINLDWESLAIDDDGRLYIADIGNNGIPFHWPRRWIYQVEEPDPRTNDSSGEQRLSVEATYPFRYPDKPFDAEGAFVRSGDLYLIEKTAAREPSAGVYRLPLSEPSTDAVLQRVGRLPGAPRVTGADISSDGRLAVCSYRYAAVYELTWTDQRLAAKRLQRIALPKTSVEGCCWGDDDRLLLVEENSKLHAGGWLRSRGE